MRSFKKIAAMIMAVAMLCSFTALAADVALLPVDDTDSDTPRVTVGYDWNATTAAQTTMVVYKNEVANGDVVYINQFAEGASNVTLELGNEYGDYTIIAGGMDVATTATEEFSYRALACDVTLTVSGAGFVENDYTAANLSATPVAVNKGEVINFEIIPHLGNVATVTVNDVNVDVNGSLAVTVNEPKNIVITFTEVAESDEFQAVSGADIHTVAGNPDATNKEDKYESKLMFGKAIAPANAEVLEAGMYLEKWDETAGEFKPYEEERTVKYGPYFKAENPIDGVYGIRFIRFNAGKYQVKSYVKYDGGEVFGTPVEFVVD